MSSCSSSSCCEKNPACIKSGGGSTKQEKDNFKRNAQVNSEELRSKGKKIARIQKKIEKQLDIFNDENQATHPDNRQYKPEKFEEKKGPEFPIRKIAVSESLTAGKLADLLASHDFAGSFFIGSMSVYTLKHKAKLLGVDEDHADEVDCVSPKVCSEMSEGILKMFGDEAEVGVGVTGFAKTEGIKDLNPHAYYCITTKEGHKRQGKIEEGLYGKERNEVRKIVAERVYLECCKVIGLKPNPEVCERHENATLKDELNQINDAKEDDSNDNDNDDNSDESEEEEEEENEKEKGKFKSSTRKMITRSTQSKNKKTTKTKPVDSSKLTSKKRKNIESESNQVKKLKSKVTA